MKTDRSILTPEERDELELTALATHPLGEQYADRAHAHETATLGMWVFLVTEWMFFGTLFVALATYRYLYPDAFARASERLNWLIASINTIVLLVSSLFMVLAVHDARLGRRRNAVVYLLLTALLGCAFLGLKSLEYYLDYRENLIPGWKFEADEWTAAGLRLEQVAHVKLFLLFYWTMTALHGLHVLIGIAVVLAIAFLAWRGAYAPEYYTPVEVTALYWHFVDLVWIFLLPMLYLLGTHARN